MRHPDDPTPEPHEYRVYGDDMAQTWVVVDQEDYQWGIQWKWHFNEPHPSRNGSKRYLCRSNGSGGRRRGKKFIFHVEIMKRKGVPPPDAEHTFVAHLDDDEFNCRRSNLEWTTARKNRTMSVKANTALANLHLRQKKNASDKKSRKNAPAG